MATARQQARQVLNTRNLRKSNQSTSAEPTYEQLKQRLALLEAQQAASIEFRIGNKGGVSVYGLGRFPVTLYYEQWIALLDNGERLRQYLEQNKRQLKLRGNGAEKGGR